MQALARTVQASDPELISAFLGGSEAAFEELMQRYQDRIFRLLSRYTRDAMECEDLAQEVFLKVFRKLHTFHHDSQFFTWLYRIAVNTATDHLARRSRRRGARQRPGRSCQCLRVGVRRIIGGMRFS